MSRGRPIVRRSRPESEAHALTDGRRGSPLGGGLQCIERRASSVGLGPPREGRSHPSVERGCLPKGPARPNEDRRRGDHEREHPTAKPDGPGHERRGSTEVCRRLCGEGPGSCDASIDQSSRLRGPREGLRGPSLGLRHPLVGAVRPTPLSDDLEVGRCRPSDERSATSDGRPASSEGGAPTTQVRPRAVDGLSGSSEAARASSALSPLPRRRCGTPSRGQRSRAASRSGRTSGNRRVDGARSRLG